MKLRTQVPLQQAEHQLDYQSQLLLLGSCFVENIGQKLDYYKFRVLQNPYGILFHPKAIENLVSRSIQDTEYTEKDIFLREERWHCFDAHSDLSDISKKALVRKLNEGLKATRKQISDSTHIVITLGTAWVYQNKASGTIVANCHKIPQKQFSKKLLSVQAIVQSLENILDLIQSTNPNVQTIFTVSPVRHLKDGFVENQQSKAHLITAIGQILSSRTDLAFRQTGSRDGHYFPSYEIMMDELRDYRFYKADMVHPSDLAVDYIWERFKEVWIFKEAFTTMGKIGEIQRGLKHKAFNPDSEEHKKFLVVLKEKIAELQKEYSFIEFKLS